ncbi:MAG TPA: SUMF1/EgtB/PvdO family nonheme iron enzyme [Chitinophagales bacterium]|nr:SUMF1/EgtB/PvdO family nonheme iron enzyme [Chitinophagales bacterium]
MPNEQGLYDMSGNVFQWCSDWFDDKYYSKSPEENPQGPGRDSYRTCRGGSWWSEEKECRVAHRAAIHPMPAMAMLVSGLLKINNQRGPHYKVRPSLVITGFCLKCVNPPLY